MISCPYLGSRVAGRGGGEAGPAGGLICPNCALLSTLGGLGAVEAIGVSALGPSSSSVRSMTGKVYSVAGADMTGRRKSSPSPAKRRGGSLKL